MFETLIKFMGRYSYVKEAIKLKKATKTLQNLLAYNKSIHNYFREFLFPIKYIISCYAMKNVEHIFFNNSKLKKAKIYNTSTQLKQAKNHKFRVQSNEVEVSNAVNSKYSIYFKEIACYYQSLTKFSTKRTKQPSFFCSCLESWYSSRHISLSRENFTIILAGSDSSPDESSGSSTETESSAESSTDSSDETESESKNTPSEQNFTMEKCDSCTHNKQVELITSRTVSDTTDISVYENESESSELETTVQTSGNVEIQQRVSCQNCNDSNRYINAVEINGPDTQSNKPNEVLYDNESSYDSSESEISDSNNVSDNIAHSLCSKRSIYLKKKKPSIINKNIIESAKRELDLISESSNNSNSECTESESSESKTDTNEIEENFERLKLKSNREEKLIVYSGRSIISDQNVSSSDMTQCSDECSAKNIHVSKSNKNSKVVEVDTHVTFESIIDQSNLIFTGRSNISDEKDSVCNGSQSISNQSISNQSTSNQSTSNQSISNQSISNQSISNQSISNQSTSNQPISNQSKDFSETMSLDSKTVNREIQESSDSQISIKSDKDKFDNAYISNDMISEDPEYCLSQQKFYDNKNIDSCLEAKNLIDKKNQENLNYIIDSNTEQNYNFGTNYIERSNISEESTERFYSSDKSFREKEYDNKVHSKQIEDLSQNNIISTDKQNNVDFTRNSKLSDKENVNYCNSSKIRINLHPIDKNEKCKIKNINNNNIINGTLHKRDISSDLKSIEQRSVFETEINGLRTPDLYTVNENNKEQIVYEHNNESSINDFKTSWRSEPDNESNHQNRRSNSEPELKVFQTHDSSCVSIDYLSQVKNQNLNQSELKLEVTNHENVLYQVQNTSINRNNSYINPMMKNENLSNITISSKIYTNFPVVSYSSRNSNTIETIKSSEIINSPLLEWNSSNISNRTPKEEDIVYNDNNDKIRSTYFFSDIDNETQNIENSKKQIIDIQVDHNLTQCLENNNLVDQFPGTSYSSPKVDSLMTNNIHSSLVNVDYNDKITVLKSGRNLNNYEFISTSELKDSMSRSVKLTYIS